MAYSIKKALEFYIETESDINSLPNAQSDGESTQAIGDCYQKVAIGSTAFCIETGNTYILNSENVWTLVGSDSDSE